MALKYLTNIDLNRGHTKGNFEKTNNSSDHPTPVAGQMYYNTADQRAYTHNGSTWDGRSWSHR